MEERIQANRMIRTRNQDLLYASTTLLLASKELLRSIGTPGNTAWGTDIARLAAAIDRMEEVINQ